MNLFSNVDTYQKMNNNHDLTVIIRSQPPSPIEETAFSQEFCRGYINKLAGKYPVIVKPRVEIHTVKELQALVKSPALLLINDDEIILPPFAFDTITAALRFNHWKGIMPVFNLCSSGRQLANIPYAFHNIRNYLEVAALHFKAQSASITKIKGNVEFPCIFLHRKVLFEESNAGLSIDELLIKLKNEGFLGQMRSVFVLRFGDYASSPRTELLSLLPDKAESILDVGCAKGELGAVLKQNRHCYLAGVEINPVMAKNAAKIYDKVYVQPVENVKFEHGFDAIFMGDVIEHLRRPEMVLQNLVQYLNQDGIIIGSIPNTGHWSIVMDLAIGRFELIPYGLLCMSHIRFFTETELSNLLRKVGLKIKMLQRDSPMPTPQGEKFIQLLVSNGVGEEKSLRTAGFLFQAVLDR